jgi:hypothetical protein
MVFLLEMITVVATSAEMCLSLSDGRARSVERIGRRI